MGSTPERRLEILEHRVASAGVRKDTDDARLREKLTFIEACAKEQAGLWDSYRATAFARPFDGILFLIERLDEKYLEQMADVRLAGEGDQVALARALTARMSWPGSTRVHAQLAST